MGPSDAVEATIKQTIQLLDAGQYDDALQMALRGINHAKLHLPETHPSRVESMAALAAVHYRMGNHAQAAALQREVIDLKRERLGLVHPDLALDLSNLAVSYRELGRLEEAEQLLSEAVSLADPASRPKVANNLGAVLKARGQYTRAEPFYRELLQSSATMGVNRAAAVNNLGMLYKAMGRYGDAERFLKEGFDLRRKLLPSGHSHLAQSAQNLGDLYLATGKHAEAGPLFQEALEMRRAALGPSNPETLQSLRALAMLAFARGDYEAGKRQMADAVRSCIDSFGENDPRTANCLSSQAVFFELAGEYMQAEEITRRALKVYRRSALANREIDAKFRLASIRGELGDHVAALDLCREALAARRAAVGAAHPSYAEGLERASTFYAARGDMRSAEDALREALEIMLSAYGEDSEAVANVRASLAVLRYNMGNYPESVSLLEQALEFQRKSLGPDHPSYTQSLQTLAGLHIAKNDYARAEPLFREVLQRWELTFNPNHPFIAQHCANLGGVCFYRGHYEEATHLYERALRIQRSMLAADHPDLTQTLNNLGLLHLAQGHHAEAERLLREALKVWENAGLDHPHRVASLVNLALVCAATDRWPDAAELLMTGSSALDGMVGQVFASASEQHRAAYLRGLRKFFDLSLSLAQRQILSSSEAAGPALDLVLRRKALRLEAWALQRDAILGGSRRELRPLLTELHTLRTQTASKILAGPGAEPIEVHRRLISDWRRRINELEARIATRIPEIKLDQQLRTVDHRVVAERLPKGSALVEFVRYRVFDFSVRPGPQALQWRPDRYMAFVLPEGSGNNVRLVDIGPAEHVDELVLAFRTSLTACSDPKTGEPVVQPGIALRQVVFDPLASCLGPIKRLFIAPDAALALVPFEALPIRHGNRLIEEYRLSYLGVGRDVLRFGLDQSARARKPVVAADPDFDLMGSAQPTGSPPRSHHRAAPLAAGTMYHRLPGTRREGEAIATMLKVTPLLDGAVLDGVVKAFRSPRILHIATHGFFIHPPRGSGEGSTVIPRLSPISSEGSLSAEQLDNPLLRSGLVLAGVNTWLKGDRLPGSAEDGVLTAEDVSGMDLTATALVVLSACDTGLGDIETGEGVFGLRRAFALAGARTLVMSLWKVPDDATSELMQEFYSGYVAGQSPSDALREAQLKLRKRYSHPLHWAAFICLGDPSGREPRAL